MKKIVIAAALIVSGLLVGCNQLTQYTVSEQEINQALEKHNNFSKDIGVPGLADAHIVLTNLASQIGREEPNKVTLSGDASLERGNFPARDGNCGRGCDAGQNETGAANADALSQPVVAELL